MPSNTHAWLMSWRASAAVFSVPEFASPNWADCDSCNSPCVWRAWNGGGAVAPQPFLFPLWFAVHRPYVLGACPLLFLGAPSAADAVPPRTSRPITAIAILLRTQSSIDRVGRTPV